GMTKIKSPKNLVGADAEKAKAAAMEVANKNLTALKGDPNTPIGERVGKLPKIVGVKSTSDKVPGVVMTEARRLAKNLIKDEIKKAGGKISSYEPKDITTAANSYLETDEGKTLLAQAQVNVDARTKVIEEKHAKGEVTLDALQSKLGLSVSAARVSKAEKA